MGRAERRRSWRRARRKLGALLLPRVGPTLVRTLARSWKVETLGRENWDAAYARAGMLATMWHGRMVLGMPAAAGKGVSVLVSPSGDGQLVPPMLARFGYSWIMGSSNKNPARAVREMLDRLRAGGRIAITPDGPRGPRHGTNPGPAWMARETGFPILPVGCATDRAWRLNSWDRFTIPKWGARVIVNYAEPIEVAPDASDEDLARVTAEMKRRMMAAEEQGFQLLGVAPDW
ncbi:MAG: lysophospholipid acyltransferase family protein [Planctomycetes bacterium]|nr:lysophospholipid acyltransferase family protein [Planctomycetota bacterium]